MADTGARLGQVEEVCHAALERDASERSAFLSVACGDDASLRREVEAILAHAQTADDFLGASVGAMAAEVMSGSAPVSWIGRRIGAFEVVSPLGAGGMGEVYRARDTQLGRDVAIKVLPSAFVADPKRLARFEREARVLASLNHPHIGAIYGVEPIDGARALILEMVEGETLADRLAKSNGSRHTSRDAGLPVTDALTFARQIAEALEAAHEKGIVHRDLKPANIKITPGGTVKVLDFGLAKTRGGGVGQTGADPSDSPTFTLGGTHEAILLGTAAYMSPEQARGQAVDKRADIWAFGSVLYEMLTSRMAFPGSTVSDHIAAILEREPEWTALPTAVPASIRRLLRRCLEKDPNRRLHDIADARIEIEDALTLPTAEAIAVVATPLKRVMPAVITALAVAVGGVLYWTPRSTPSETVHFSVSVPGRLLAPSYIAMAPDGRQVAFVATDSSGRRLLGTATWDGRTTFATRVALRPPRSAVGFGTARSRDRCRYPSHLSPGRPSIPNQDWRSPVIGNTHRS